MKEEFIRFDNFLVKKNDIIYAQLEDEKKLKIIIKEGDSTKSLTMIYPSDWEAEKALDILSADTNASTADHWQHSLVRQMYGLRGTVRECTKDMEKIKQELKSLRLELRRNRINIKKAST